MTNRTTDDSGNVTVAVPIAISTPICHNWYDCVHRTLVTFDVKHPYTVSVSDLDSINCVPITVAVGTKNIKSPSVIDAYNRCVCPQHTSSSFTGHDGLHRKPPVWRRGAVHLYRFDHMPKHVLYLIVVLRSSCCGLS